jgi:hypothetical protein
MPNRELPTQWKMVGLKSIPTIILLKSSKKLYFSDQKLPNFNHSISLIILTGKISFHEKQKVLFIIELFEYSDDRCAADI